MKRALCLLLTGLAIGIFIAPDKGTNTWKKITDCFDDLKEKAKENMSDLADSVSELIGKGEKPARDI